MTKDEALVVAIDLIKYLKDSEGLHFTTEEHIFRQALNQPESKPVAVVGLDTSSIHMYYGQDYLGKTPERKTVVLFKDLPLGTQLYTKD